MLGNVTSQFNNLSDINVNVICTRYHSCPSYCSISCCCIMHNNAHALITVMAALISEISEIAWQCTHLAAGCFSYDAQKSIGKY